MWSPSPDDIGIIKAAADGDLNRLQQLKLKIGDDVDFRKRCEILQDCQGRTSLHYAAYMGLIHMCKFLVEEVKVDIDIKNQMGDSPLLLAVAARHINTAKYLIIRGANIAISDYKGMTSLHYAAEEDNKELMQMLLLRGACIETDSVRGTPLQCAVSCGNVESIRFLLGRGAKSNPVSRLSHSPLMLAIISNSCECLELLLKAGANPNISSLGLTPLAFAARKGETEFLKSLLATGVDRNSTTSDGLMTPIEHAASANYREGVQILFPLTDNIPNYPNWSTDGIMKHFHSEEAGIQRVEKKRAHVQFLNNLGKDAAKRKDYSEAVERYSEAINVDSSDARLLSNRSLCWANLNEGASALFDAKACVRLRPYWPKAHYREGVAWMLLKNHHMASRAFLEASTLDPGNMEIQKAHRAALGYALLDLEAKAPQKAWNMLQAWMKRE